MNTYARKSEDFNQRIDFKFKEQIKKLDQANKEQIEKIKSIENESVETIYELIRNEFGPIYSLEYSDSGDSLILKDYHLPYILEYDEELLYEDYWYDNEY